MWGIEDVRRLSFPTQNTTHPPALLRAHLEYVTQAYDTSQIDHFF